VFEYYNISTILYSLVYMYFRVFLIFSTELAWFSINIMLTNMLRPCLPSEVPGLHHGEHASFLLPKNMFSVLGQKRQI
jgi:hypothetical protein